MLVSEIPDKKNSFIFLFHKITISINRISDFAPIFYLLAPINIVLQWTKNGLGDLHQCF